MGIWENTKIFRLWRNERLWPLCDFFGSLIFWLDFIWMPIAGWKVFFVFSIFQSSKLLPAQAISSLFCWYSKTFHCIKQNHQWIIVNLFSIVLTERWIIEMIKLQWTSVKFFKGSEGPSILDCWAKSYQT